MTIINDKSNMDLKNIKIDDILLIIAENITLKKEVEQLSSKVKSLEEQTNILNNEKYVELLNQHVQLISKQIYSNIICKCCEQRLDLIRDLIKGKYGICSNKIKCPILSKLLEFYSNDKSNNSEYHSDGMDVEKSKLMMEVFGGSLDEDITKSKNSTGTIDQCLLNNVGSSDEKTNSNNYDTNLNYDKVSTKPNLNIQTSDLFSDSDSSGTESINDDGKSNKSTSSNRQEFNDSNLNVNNDIFDTSENNPASCSVQSSNNLLKEGNNISNDIFDDSVNSEIDNPGENVDQNNIQSVVNNNLSDSDDLSDILPIKLSDSTYLFDLSSSESDSSEILNSTEVKQNNDLNNINLSEESDSCNDVIKAKDNKSTNSNSNSPLDNSESGKLKKGFIDIFEDIDNNSDNSISSRGRDLKIVEDKKIIPELFYSTSYCSKSSSESIDNNNNSRPRSEAKKRKAPDNDEKDIIDKLAKQSVSRKISLKQKNIPKSNYKNTKNSDTSKTFSEEQDSVDSNIVNKTNISDHDNENIITLIKDMWISNEFNTTIVFNEEESFKIAMEETFNLLLCNETNSREICNKNYQLFKWFWQCPGLITSQRRSEIFLGVGWEKLRGNFSKPILIMLQVVLTSMHMDDMFCQLMMMLMLSPGRSVMTSLLRTYTSQVLSDRFNQRFHYIRELWCLLIQYELHCPEYHQAMIQVIRNMPSKQQQWFLDGKTLEEFQQMDIPPKGYYDRKISSIFHNVKFLKCFTVWISSKTTGRSFIDRIKKLIKLKYHNF